MNHQKRVFMENMCDFFASSLPQRGPHSNAFAFLTGRKMTMPRDPKLLRIKWDLADVAQLKDHAWLDGCSLSDETRIDGAPGR